MCDYNIISSHKFFLLFPYTPSKKTYNLNYLKALVVNHFPQSFSVVSTFHQLQPVIPFKKVSHFNLKNVLPIEI